MDKLLFVSDPHICPAGETIIGLDPAERLLAVLSSAIAEHPDAQAMILLGDLTHRGDVASYRRLAGLLAMVPMQVIPMLGNHDRRDTFLQVFPDAPRTSGGYIQHVQDIGRHRIVTLDSLDGPPYAKGHHAGRLCAQRLAFLDAALSTRQGRHAVVCIHHPPFDTGIIGMDKIKLADGNAFLDRLAKHGNLHLVCGHIHRTMSGRVRDVSWSMFKSPCHQGLLDLHVPNAHLSSNEPGAYGIALLGDDGIVVHTEDVGLDDRKVYGGYGIPE